MDDPLNAFVAHDSVQLPGSSDGPLAGLSFAVKDIYDLAGHVTGCGNPDWLASHPAAPDTAPAVTALLAAGADLAGKTQTNELAYSLTGENVHYGTPVNVNAAGRVPGGSSSGSAAAVAGGLVDVALGSDTGGSVRIPASFCGLYGIRPSHGRIPLQGIMPLAPSFDTVGWFARSGELLARLGEILLPDHAAAPLPAKLLVAGDAFTYAGDAVTAALRGPLAQLEALLGAGRPVDAVDGRFDDWAAHFRTLQAHEVWQSHGAWVQAQSPRFGPGVAERFAAAARITAAEAAASSEARTALRQRLYALLQDGAVLCLPTAPGIAPRCAAPEVEMDAVRQRILGLTCLAGLTGLPQVSLPLGRLDGCPLGLSLIGAAGSDEVLLAAARHFGTTIDGVAAANGD